MPWPPRRLEPPVTCQFSTCSGQLALKFYKRFSFLAGTEAILDELEPKETWLCIAHEALVEGAKKEPGITVLRTREGHIWIDNTMFVLFG